MTTRNARPVVSIVLATYNRRAELEHTLDWIDECGLGRGDFETIVVDNASHDGTCDAIGGRVTRLIRLPRNAGSTAKAFGADEARGRFLLLLDDDSYPRPGSLDRMIEHFESDPTLAAAGFTVHLPSGLLEGGALPGVFVGCGAGVRAEAYRAVGGLDRSFFMQAEEYDLCFRLARVGWKVDVFDDLHVEHLKTEHARRSDRTAYYDTRNNLRVIARYLPGPSARIYREDSVQRYDWLAQGEGKAHRRAFRRGRSAGSIRGAVERLTHRRRRLSMEAFERFFGWTFIREQMIRLKESGIRRIVLADLGKNIYPFHTAAREVGLDIRAIADNRFAGPERFYRGTPILHVEESLTWGPDALVVSNSAPVHSARTAALLALKTRLPVHAWFGGTRATPTPRDGLMVPAQLSDERDAESLGEPDSRTPPHSPTPRLYPQSATRSQERTAGRDD